ncbi:MAG: hypothetical protein J6B64_01305 [Bacilli bacterium]|nr:hypothetical protein [Bacilli bacterium]MBP3635139.1 hypothetical protein [Bacilli bacterium]
MYNKIFKKILLILLITIFMFFIKINDVRADAEIKCVYYSFQSFIDGNGHPIYSGDSDTGSPVIQIIYRVGSGDAWFDTEFDYRIFGIDNIPDSVSDADWNDKKTRLDKFADSSFTRKVKKSGCPDYVKLTSGLNTGLKESSKSDFNNYISTLYNNKNITKKNDYIWTADNVLNEGMVFISRDASEKYPDAHMNAALEVEKVTKFCGMSSKEKNYTQILYDSYKDEWEKTAGNAYKIVSDVAGRNNLKVEGILNIINSLIDGNKHSISSSKTISEDDMNLLSPNVQILVSFRKWFELVKRNAFEEDLDKYSNFYKWAQPGYQTFSDKDDADKCSNTGAYLNKKIETDSIVNAVSKDECLSICYSIDDENGISSPGVDKCKDSEDYKTCKMCLNIESSTDQDICWNKNPEVKEKMDKNIKKIEKYSSKITSELRDNLQSVSAPLSKIKFEPYKVRCEDVAFLHTIYKIMVIAAPILVILLGSLDYAKSVMASDEKKIVEFRKKLPKRIILLVLFILVPLIVSSILNIADMDTTLIYCVVNGK